MEMFLALKCQRNSHFLNFHSRCFKCKELRQHASCITFMSLFCLFLFYKIKSACLSYSESWEENCAVQWWSSSRDNRTWAWTSLYWWSKHDKSTDFQLLVHLNMWCLTFHPVLQKQFEMSGEHNQKRMGRESWFN